MNNNDILVSAIITTHNRSDLVERAINSVLNQTYNNIEVIVVDDASDKIHFSKLISLAQKYHIRVISISKAETKGGNYARNLGIKNSKGDLLAFLDDDDEWIMDKIEKQVRYILNHPDCSVVGCGRTRIILKDNCVVDEILDIPALLDNGLYSENIFIGPVFVTSELMISKYAIDRVGAFDDSLRAWQEYDLLIRLSEISNFGCVPESLVNYYIYTRGTGRLSNKIDIFLASKDIITSKYHERIEKLPSTIKMQWEKLILEECANRCRCNNIKLERKFRKDIYHLEPSLKNLIYYIFNIDRSNNRIIRGLVKIRNSKKNSV